MKTVSKPPTHEAITARARQLWEDAGRPAGRDQELWLRAEEQLRSEIVPPARPPAKPRPIPESPAHTVPSTIREVVQPVARPTAPRPAKKRGAR